MIGRLRLSMYLKCPGVSLSTTRNLYTSPLFLLPPTFRPNFIFSNHQNLLETTTNLFTGNPLDHLPHTKLTSSPVPKAFVDCSSANTTSSAKISQPPYIRLICQLFLPSLALQTPEEECPSRNSIQNFPTNPQRNTYSAGGPIRSKGTY